MKLLADDSRFRFKGFGNCDCHCQMRIYGLNDDRLLLHLHDPADNDGTTVTNGVEGLTTIVFNTVVPHLEIKEANPEDLQVIISSDHDSKLMYSLVTFSKIEADKGVKFSGRDYKFAGWTFEEAVNGIKVNMKTIKPPTARVQ